MSRRTTRAFVSVAVAAAMCTTMAGTGVAQAHDEEKLVPVFLTFDDATGAIFVGPKGGPNLLPSDGYYYEARSVRQADELTGSQETESSWTFLFDKRGNVEFKSPYSNDAGDESYLGYRIINGALFDFTTLDRPKKNVPFSGFAQPGDLELPDVLLVDSLFGPYVRTNPGEVVGYLGETEDGFIIHPPHIGQAGDSHDSLLACVEDSQKLECTQTYTTYDDETVAYTFTRTASDELVDSRIDPSWLPNFGKYAADPKGLADLGKKVLPTKATVASALGVKAKSLFGAAGYDRAGATYRKLDCGTPDCQATFGLVSDSKYSAYETALEATGVGSCPPAKRLKNDIVVFRYRQWCDWDKNVHLVVQPSKKLGVFKFAAAGSLKQALALLKAFA